MQISTLFGPAWAVVLEDGSITEFGWGTLPRIRERRSLVSIDEETKFENPDLPRQLDEYFAGKRQKFDLPLAPRGTEFQKQVWAELLKVPYGETITYTELARRVGREKAHRAAGRANSSNRIALLIPCHRVVGLNGDLAGYAYGVSLKKKLLEFEREMRARTSTAA